MEQLKTGGDGNTFLYGSLTEVPDKLLTNELPGQELLAREGEEF